METLHHTLKTSSFLLLLEFIPGEDLFFLEQAHDHYDESPSSKLSISSSHTPPSPSLSSNLHPSHTLPTPSLLLNLHPSQLLSHNRLQLITSMFSQMCEAVAACRHQHVMISKYSIGISSLKTNAVGISQCGRRQWKFGQCDDICQCQPGFSGS